MPTTTNLALPYPALSSAPNVPADMAALAAAVDTYVFALETATTKWTSFSPLLYQSMTTTKASISRTLGNCWYMVRNNYCVAHAEVTATASSTGGAGLALPVTPAERWTTCGSGGVFGTSPPTQSGVAYMGIGLDVILTTTFTNAFCDIISGQTFRYSIVYKV